MSGQYSNGLTELKSDVRYSVWSSDSWLDISQCTKTYPKALMSWLPLSASVLAMFPHVLESSCLPPVPNPILELQEWQSPSSLARIPILALERVVHSALKPSLLQVHELQGSIRTNHGLPFVTAQWGAAVLPISDQWIQGTGAFDDFSKIDLVVNLDTKADLGEGCVPGGGKFWSPVSQIQSCLHQH